MDLEGRVQIPLGNTIAVARLSELLPNGPGRPALTSATDYRITNPLEVLGSMSS